LFVVVVLLLLLSVLFNDLLTTRILSSWGAKDGRQGEGYGTTFLFNDARLRTATIPSFAQNQQQPPPRQQQRASNVSSSLPLIQDASMVNRKQQSQPSETDDNEWSLSFLVPSFVLQCKADLSKRVIEYLESKQRRLRKEMEEGEDGRSRLDGVVCDDDDESLLTLVSFTFRVSSTRYEKQEYTLVLVYLAAVADECGGEIECNNSEFVKRDLDSSRSILSRDFDSIPRRIARFLLDDVVALSDVRLLPIRADFPRFNIMTGNNYGIDEFSRLRLSVFASDVLLQRALDLFAVTYRGEMKKYCCETSDSNSESVEMSSPSSSSSKLPTLRVKLVTFCLKPVVAVLLSPQSFLCSEL
jgi:hypothetical protein